MNEEGGGSRSGEMSKMNFAMQIGLCRESVTLEGGELTLSTLKEIAYEFVDRKVNEYFDDSKSVFVLKGLNLMIHSCQVQYSCAVGLTLNWTLNRVDVCHILAR